MVLLVWQLTMNLLEDILTIWDTMWLASIDFVILNIPPSFLAIMNPFRVPMSQTLWFTAEMQVIDSSQGLNTSTYFKDKSLLIDILIIFPHWVPKPIDVAVTTWHCIKRLDWCVYVFKSYDSVVLVVRSRILILDDCLE